MPSSASTDTAWSTDLDTLRREKIFRNPPARTAYPALQEAFRPHTDSFNSLFDHDEHLLAALEDIGIKAFYEDEETEAERVDRKAEGGKRRRNKLSVRIRSIYLEKPALPSSNKFTVHRNIYPAECRERHATYRGRLKIKLEYRVNNGEWRNELRDMGRIPIMLRSNRCHLEHCTPAQLVQAKEESEEFGGYFIVNGNEKLIRLLIVSKRNYPMAIIRKSFVNRGGTYTKYGVTIRSVRPDQTSQSIVLHYCDDGMVMFRFSWRKSEYLIPVMLILRALVDTNDREVCENLIGLAGTKGVDNSFLTDRVELLLRSYKSYPIGSKAKTRAYLGKKFRPVLDVAEGLTDEEVGNELLRKVVLVHLGNVRVSEAQNRDKFKLLLFMIRKLYSLVAGDCAADNPDAVSNQEVLLGGFLYGMIIKERLDDWLSSIADITRELCASKGRSTTPLTFTSPDFPKFFATKILGRTVENIGNLVEYFLSTGNLISRSGLDLQQTSGFTVVAERINFYRFISHFRMIHRGSFFAQLRTTTVRKLLPESWGFLCPIHTPDGAPCGLLNHMAHKCRITTRNLDVSALPQLLTELGVSDFYSASTDESVVVQLDGRIQGFCSPQQARVVADTLRYWKVEGSHKIPLELEIGYVPNSKNGQYPGLYIFSQSARFIRPCLYLPLERLDFIGPFEQPHMSVACSTSEIQSGECSHVEFDPTHILSIVANQTPFSDFNQSPRNMYQCQMSKQAMGTPGTSSRYRTDNKSYRLQTGQTPVVRSPLYNTYGLDNFPNGMNAVVAVISYTGYDMDDAMIINKSAHERGFGNGTVYKTKIIELSTKQRGSSSKAGVTQLFGFAPRSTRSAQAAERLDDDGLPRIGERVQEGDILYATHFVSFDPSTKSYVNRDEITHYEKYKEVETAYVEELRLLGSETGDSPCQTLSLKLRIPRSPVIGDKFSSRHGQKGVCSQKWPASDMPFSESGIIPDVIINPHAFPSRMTIGMLVESLAGKSGALHGIAQDGSPWRFDENNTAADFMGDQLVKAGYNFYGNEPMYSGITGQEFAADIYIGVVFYQRLRHMVNDKFQVRTTGPVTALTGQPIKGRAKGGGIRIGEMERDALLAHGCAFLLQDRLLNCSDYTRAWVCRNCGSFLSTQSSVARGAFGRRSGNRGGPVRCRRCAVRATDRLVKLTSARVNGGLVNGHGQHEDEFDEEEDEVWQDGQGEKWVGGDDVRLVAIPGVLRYLDVELAAMGIRMKFHVDP